jgi:hypothetical protein
MAAPLVVYGPQGCGKTANAKAIADYFYCTLIVDDWDGRSALPDGALALCQRYPRRRGCDVLSFQAVMAAMKARPRGTP